MIVIDASVALKWVLPEADSDEAFLLQGQPLLAPDIWLVEAANALWRRSATGGLTAVDVQLRYDVLQGAPVSMLSSAALLPAALDIAVRLNHPIYDCIYLEAAIQHDTHVVTADKRFVRAVARNASLKKHVKLLA